MSAIPIRRPAPTQRDSLPIRRISDDRFAGWTSVGPDATAQRTYESIKAALRHLIVSRDVEVFLQGSYPNHTNIRGDSDIDVVVMTRQSFASNAHSPSLPRTLQAEWSSGSPALYTSNQLRADVLTALQHYYGRSVVEEKNKCIKVHKRDGYLDADVVPCIEYRHYLPTAQTLESRFKKEGVAITPLSGPRIINFPKVHIENGQAKNKDCHKRYKPTVRQIKRLRNEAVHLGFLADGLAPGYLLECMVFNAPRGAFRNHDVERMRAIVDWFADKGELSSFMSCDRIHTLFGTDPGGFTVERCQQIISGLRSAINA